MAGEQEPHTNGLNGDASDDEVRDDSISDDDDDDDKWSVTHGDSDNVTTINLLWNTTTSSWITAIV